MKNEPSNTDQGPKNRSPTPSPPSPEVTSSNTAETATDEADIYQLPAPLPAAPEAGGKCPRIPPTRPPPILQGVDLELQISDSTPPAILLSNHMVR